MKKIFYFLALFLYGIGAIGGIGYAIYSGAWVIAIAVAVLAIMAFPTAKKLYHLLAE